MVNTRERLTVNAYVDAALQTHAFLLQQSDLSPRNPALNATLSTFVTETMRPRPEEEIAAILEVSSLQKIAPELRKLLGQAEYAMECFCASAMTGNEPEADLGYASYPEFLYRKHYETLVDLEMTAMGWPHKQPALNRETQSVAFVGAGPLPISAIMLHLRTGLPVTCIDSNEEACHLGRNLLRHLAASGPKLASLSNQMSYVHSAGHKHDYVTHPVVFVASLVDSKDPVIFRILESSNTGSMVIVRSAEGLSTLLYEPHECTGSENAYNLYFARKTPHSSDAVNTSLVFKFPSGKPKVRNKVDFSGPKDDVYLLGQRPRRMWRTRPLAAAI